MIAHGQMWDVSSAHMSCGTMSIRTTTDRQTVFSHFRLLYLFERLCLAEAAGWTYEHIMYTQVCDRKHGVNPPPRWNITLPKQSLLLNTFSLFHHRFYASELDMSAAEHQLEHMFYHFYMSICGLRIRVGTLAHLLSLLVVWRDLHGKRRWNAAWVDLNINVVR